MSTQEIVLTVLVIAIALGVFYMLDPTFGGLLHSKKESFTDAPPPPPPSVKGEHQGQFNNSGEHDTKTVLNAKENASDKKETRSPMVPSGTSKEDTTEGFENVNPSPMPFLDAEKPTNCYPKNQLAPQELLPNDPNSKWAQVNPMGAGDIAGKNFLNAGSLIGVNTVGQSLRNASWDLRSEPPNPQLQVSPWMQSTIEPELQRRPLEIA